MEMKEHFDLVISIGTDCSVAGSLRAIGYKDSSYPFDWAVTDDFEWVIQNFSDDFTGYRAELTAPANDTRPILFPHDDKATKAFVEKYTRRIDRLLSICGQKSPPRVLFVRKGEHDQISQATRLAHIIEDKYPDLEFKVLLLNNLAASATGQLIQPATSPVLHVYIADKDCFLRNRHQHRNCKLAYATVQSIISDTIVSERFRQPAHRDSG